MLDPIETESSLKLACDDGVARLCHNFEAVSARTCSVLGVRRRQIQDCHWPGYLHRLPHGCYVSARK